jgi:hypothetical protein
MATRRYFQSPEKWTPDRDDAYDFGVVSRAVKIAHKLRIRGLELVVSLDDPQEVANTPLAHLLHTLSHPNRHLAAHSRA